MVCLLERFLSEDLTLTKYHVLLTNFNIHERIEVKIYTDSPLRLALFYVDGKPILKEELVDNITEYIINTKNQIVLIDFLLEYVKKS